MIERILPALYRNYPREERSQLWDWCMSYATIVDVTPENLDNMANNGLVHGFFGGTHQVVNEHAVISLAQALGVYGIQNPENGNSVFPTSNYLGVSTDDILNAIEKKIGFAIDLPRFVGGRKDTMTGRGIITDRHCHYLYVAKRITDLFPNRDTRIIEVGAGLGLLGYFLDKLGYKDYTTIDLAYTNVCQAWFLHKNLSERELILSNEVENPFCSCHNDKIKILHSSDFSEASIESYDLMVNMDGLTEMKEHVAFGYFRSRVANTLLSINHEVNKFRVCELDPNEKFRKREYRYPFWVRHGYVEELYKLQEYGK